MPADREILSVLASDELMRRLATVEHERWAHWQQYVHASGERRQDGALVIPAELVARWESQIATPYAQLSTDEQQSDQEQVRRYLPILVEMLTSQVNPTWSQTATDSD
jgi:hypothetical protein